MRNHLIRPLLAAALSCLGPQVLSAATPDTAQLRQALAAAFGGDVEIARTELSDGLRERGGIFWLVYAAPRRSGNYELSYRYEYHDRVHPENPLYTHVEHTSYVRVGEAGCWRRGEGRDVCLGDTIILPFVVSDYTGHTFRVTRHPLPPDEAPPQPEPLYGVDTTGSGAIPNPLSAHLRYLGSQSGESLRRNGGGSIIYSATFAAVAPGRFNLAVSTRGPGESPPPASAYGSVPVIIVPRGQPVTVLLANETVVGRDEKHGFSSHSGNQYLTTALILQPGDRITLNYGSRPLPGPGHRPPPAFAVAAEPAPLDAPVPLIGGFPFRLDTGERFNAWIADHLPHP
ncbi:MAG TPA: hypothetical protein VFR37_13800 [Longimicrobium sp.]|nr:hypothetical protein [Longimicrobium sp.]